MVKARAYRMTLHGWHYRILIDTFLVRNRAIFLWLRTAHTLRWPILSIETVT